MANKWYEIAVFTTDMGLDTVCAVFDSLGIEGLVIEESRETVERFLNSSAKYWDYADLDNMQTEGQPCVKAYVQDLSEAKNAESVFTEMKGKDFGIDIGSLNVEIREKDEEDWANNWKLYYKPINIGERLLVCPSWEEVDNTENRTLLKLDPGMAFGTGSHPTTSMCLEYLERTVKSGDTTLDLGCGSGILFIAALLLGSKNAIGVDIDPIAEKIARENADLNQVDESSYEVFAGDILTDKCLVAKVSDIQYDIVVANIVANVIIELAPLAYSLTKNGGTFITSGIIFERLDEVKEALVKSGFEILEDKRTDDWCAIMCKKA